LKEKKDRFNDILANRNLKEGIVTRSRGRNGEVDPVRMLGETFHGRCRKNPSFGYRTEEKKKNR